MGGEGRCEEWVVGGESRCGEWVVRVGVRSGW